MSLPKFLHKVPSQRADYLKLADTTLFLRRFFPIRWVENDVTADRGIQIWDGIVKLIKFISQKPESFGPKDKSFGNFGTAPQQPMD